MKQVCRLQMLMMLIVSTILLCMLTGCASPQFDRTDNRQVMLEVPIELLEPVSPLLVIDRPINQSDNKPSKK